MKNIQIHIKEEDYNYQLDLIIIKNPNLNNPSV